jgi:hypothetical protein
MNDPNRITGSCDLNTHVIQDGIREQVLNQRSGVYRQDPAQ